MTQQGAVALAALLFALLCIVVGLLVWQEARRRPDRTEPTYVVEDAVRFIVSRLPPDTRSRLGTTGVRRIIEWEVYYLQGLAQKSRRNPVETVAGGSDASIDYIVAQIAEVNRAIYDRDDVGEVLGFEAEYLQSIGAVGETVDGDDSDEGGEEA